MELTIYRTGESGCGRTAQLPVGKMSGELTIPTASSHYGIVATRWAYIRDFLPCPLACAWGSRGARMGREGHQFFRSMLHSPWHPHSSLSLSSASPGWGHYQQASPVLQPVLTKAGNGCGASACYCGEEGLEFGLMFSIHNNRALVKPQRRRCYRCSKLIVRRVAQMWDPKA